MPRLRPAPKEEEELKVTAPAQPEVEVEEAPEIEVEIAEELEKKVEQSKQQQDDATIALKKQIEDLRNSERLVKEQLEQANKSREEAIARSLQRDSQIAKVQKQAYESEVDAIAAALTAAEISMQKAKLDKRNAIDLGDSAAQVDADERMALAAADIRDLKRGKEEAEARAKETPAEPEVDPIDTWNLPKITTDWLKNHRDWLTDPEKFENLKGFQWQAKREGVTPHTQEFLDYIEDRMNGKEPEAKVETKEETPKSKGPIVSAPVSRDVPNSSGKRTPGKVTLTPAEVDAARISGISIEEYAKQKVRKAEMIASGEYGEQR